MVFLAENFEVNQSCVYKIPRLSEGNWGALHQVLFCWNQNLVCGAAGQGDVVLHLIWGGRSLGASLCLFFALLSFLPFPASLEILSISRWKKSVCEYTHVGKDSVVWCPISIASALPKIAHPITIFEIWKWQVFVSQGLSAKSESLFPL